MRTTYQSHGQNLQEEGWPNDHEAGTVVDRTADLLEEIAEGSIPAFESLYDRCWGLVYTICVRVLKHELEAQDVLSEIFLEVWQRAYLFDPSRGTAESFLITISRSRAIDRKRKIASRDRNKSTGSALVELNSVESRDVCHPADTIIAQEERYQVQSALTELNEDQRRTVEAHYYDGLTHKQISSKYQLPLGTVKTTIRQSIRVLGETLRRLDQESEIGSLYSPS